MWRGCLLHRCSNTQGTTAQSSCEAELYGLTTGAMEGIHLQQLMGELTGVEHALVLQTDSHSAIQNLNKRQVGRLKHVMLKHLFIKELLRDGRLALKFISGTSNPADVLTKSVGALDMTRHLEGVGAAAAAGL